MPKMISTSQIVVFWQLTSTITLYQHQYWPCTIFSRVQIPDFLQFGLISQVTGGDTLNLFVDSLYQRF